MGNYLFILRNCPRCGPLEWAVMAVNRQLPMEDKVEMIDILSGDSRVNLLRERLGGSITKAPVTIINHSRIKKQFKSYVKGFNRVIVDSVYTIFHAKVLLKNLIYFKDRLIN